MTPARAGTDVEAVNVALAKLGQTPVATLDDNTARARAARSNYALARDLTLQSANWGFATGYSSPAEATAPAQGWGGGFLRRFPLPPDCIKVRSVKDSEADAWEVLSAASDPAGSAAEVKVLATNIATPAVCYTRLIANVRLWPPAFVEAFAHRLAAMIAPTLVGSTAKADSEEQKASAWASDAAAVDSKEKARRTVSRDTSWVRARRVGGGAGRGR